VILTHLVVFSFFDGASGSDAVVTPSVTSTPAGKPKAGRRKRWWRVGDRVYLGTEQDAERMLDAFLALQSGEVVDPPKLKSKPAPVRPIRQSAAVQIRIPDLPVHVWDWRPAYVQSMLQRDMEQALAIEAAVRRRMELDEDDLEVLLLLH
jgi:hypothetical protein